MREILFRGKRVDNGEWVEGFYGKGIFKFDDKTQQDRYYILTWDTFKCEFNRIEVIPETVSRFAGLKDKNGVNFFEGDIIMQKTTQEFKKYNNFEWEHYGIVRHGFQDFREGTHGYATMCWYVEPMKNVAIYPLNYLIGNISTGICQNYINDVCYPYEIIGNIFDNPELLESEVK